MTALCGTEPTKLIAAIGPSIGRCCYEVGRDVSARFEQLFPEGSYGTSDDAQYLDLREANRRQLMQAGLSPECIDVSADCTRCGTSEFHSWRRDRESAGRMTAAVRAL